MDLFKRHNFQKGEIENLNSPISINWIELQ